VEDRYGRAIGDIYEGLELRNGPRVVFRGFTALFKLAGYLVSDAARWAYRRRQSQ